MASVQCCPTQAYARAPRGGTPGGSDVLDPKIGETHARGKVDAVEGDVNVHSAAGEKSAALDASKLEAEGEAL